MSVTSLIICPKSLVSMWQEYVNNYRLLAEVMPSPQNWNNIMFR
ncbi:hypothetical protein [Nostoc sp.]